MSTLTQGTPAATAKPLPIFKVGVVGGGAMGGGIAQVVSNAGLPVVIRDISQEAVDQGIRAARKVYESRVKKGKLSANEMEQKMALVSGTTTWEGFEDVDLVIEAVTEKMDIKKKVFAELDAVVPKTAILASNTSALSVTELGRVTQRPGLVAGLHFFNPAPVMKLVEVIEGQDSTAQTMATLMAFCTDLRKHPVQVKDGAGFLVNRLLLASFNEAVLALEDGSTTAEDMDARIPSLGFPMGPFALADMIGVEVCNEVVHTLNAAFGDRFKPGELLDWMVVQGRWGQKRGKGFYSYDDEATNPVPGKVAEIIAAHGKTAEPFDPLRFILPMINEAAILIDDGVARLEDVDPAMQMGTGMGHGPLLMADRLGLDTVVAKLEHYAKVIGPRFTPAPLLVRMVAEGKLGAKSGQGFHAHEVVPEGQKVRVYTQVAIEEGAALLTLSNPPANALGAAVIAELDEVVQELAADPAVKAIVLTGGGTLAFVAGADIKEINDIQSAEQARQMLDQANAVFNRIERLRKPVIVAVNGFCLGGGCELAMACHVRIASDKARFGQPEINLGIIPGFGGSQRLPRIIGYGAATEWLLTGDMYTAQQAQRLGLVQKVVPAGEEVPTALALARKIATKGAVAIAATMEALDRGRHLSIEDAIQVETEQFARVTETEDKKIGVKAFITKTPAKFVDR
ncbi:MAG: enoyl-CoA hydratase-related protein [bacterium]|nr:enoyl-CoA hydratase-related protein [bacterium]